MTIPPPDWPIHREQGVPTCPDGGLAAVIVDRGIYPGRKDGPIVRPLDEQRQITHPGQDFLRARRVQWQLLQEARMLRHVLGVIWAKRFSGAGSTVWKCKALISWLPMTALARPASINCRTMRITHTVLGPPINEVTEEDDPTCRLSMRPAGRLSVPAEGLQRDPQLLGLAMDVRNDVSDGHMCRVFLSVG